jgi:predicted polyphosphate/ATP-dependent NAD kinase
MERLGLRNTLSGVDAVYNKELIGLDLNELQLLDLIEGRKATIVVGVIGSQGFLFGRGNQQIGARVIRRIGKENIIVVATMEKILTLRGNPLLVDTGDPEVDGMLRGYMQVVTGLGERIILRVES